MIASVSIPPRGNGSLFREKECLASERSRGGAELAIQITGCSRRYLIKEDPISVDGGKPEAPTVLGQGEIDASTASKHVRAPCKSHTCSQRSIYELDNR